MDKKFSGSNKKPKSPEKKKTKNNKKTTEVVKKNKSHKTDKGHYKECSNKHMDESIMNMFEKCTIL
jgi:hypothetical protein